MENEKCYVANGEQAEVLEVTSTKIIARMTQPDRTILIPRSNKSTNEDGDSAPSDGGDDNSEEASGSGCNWELGFAISCHKSQGSEWPVVIVMADDYNGAKMVQSKQWLYTGISRAKKLGLLIGKASTVREMCQRDALFKRKTLLREKIDALRESAGSEVVASVATVAITKSAELSESDAMVLEFLKGI